VPYHVEILKGSYIGFDIKGLDRLSDKKDGKTTFFSLGSVTNYRIGG
jgi:hypothetical protein